MTRSAPDALRRAERRRKLQDAARILPGVGAVLSGLPLLWRTDGVWNIAAVTVYLFALWGALIVAAALIARVLGARV